MVREVCLNQDPLFVAFILLAVVVGAQKWSVEFQNARIMRYLPTPVWCYIPPTLLTTLGILPSKSVVYDGITNFVLPACLILLLMTTDVEGLKKVSRPALTAMACATSSVLIGAIGVFLLFRSSLGTEGWKVISTLTASWIGGTVNMLAVKQATELSDQTFTPLFLSDITVVYTWMTFLMVISSNQNKIDRWMNVTRRHMDQALVHAGPAKSTRKKMESQSLLALLAIGFGLGAACIWLGNRLPILGAGMNTFTWIIILVTTLGLWLSRTRYAKQESANASRVGYFLLYFVLAATGAKANLTALLHAPIFLAICFVWVGIHAALLLLAGRVFGIPSAMLATASQANLGGVASAPIVASTYEPKLVPVALILAILGNAVANYFGILMGQFLLRLTG